MFVSEKRPIKISPKKASVGKESPTILSKNLGSTTFDQEARNSKKSHYRAVLSDAIDDLGKQIFIQIVGIELQTVSISIKHYFLFQKSLRVN